MKKKLKKAKKIKKSAFDKPLTDKEWESLDKFFGVNELPNNAKKAVLKMRGRPKAEKTKTQITLRIDEDVLNEFKKLGVGWQTRINDVLKEYWV